MNIDWPYFLAFGALMLVTLSSVTTLFLARMFANKDLDEPAPGKAWERCTTLSVPMLPLSPEHDCEVGALMPRPGAGKRALAAAWASSPGHSDDTQPTPVLPKDEK